MRLVTPIQHPHANTVTGSESEQDHLTLRAQPPAKASFNENPQHRLDSCCSSACTVNFRPILCIEVGHQAVDAVDRDQLALPCGPHGRDRLRVRRHGLEG